MKKTKLTLSRQLNLPSLISSAALVLSSVSTGALGSYVLRWAIPDLPASTVFTTFFIPAVLVSAWYGGRAPGIAATFSSALLMYFVSRPEQSLGITDDLARILAFTIVGACLSFIVSFHRHIRDQSLENAERLRTTLASIGDAVIVTDDVCRITMMNATGERLTGWPASDAIGNPVAEVFRVIHEEDRTEVVNLNVSARELSGIRLSDHAVLVSRHGAEYPIHATIAPIRAGLKQHGAVVVFRDVTVERRNQERVESARAQLEEANRLKDQFLAMVSHELRTPLTSIVGWAALIRHKRLEPETLDMALATIDRNAKLQMQLVEDLLDVSRITAGTFRLERTLVQVDAVISAAIDALRTGIDEKRIVLTFKAQPCPAMYLDPNRFQQVLWNLLSNAIKFTPPLGRIDVEAKVNGHTLEVWIKDSGRGFPPDFQPYLFERFKQADPRDRQGLGLGLSIVRHIIELHGGVVEGHSNGLHKGATFILRLPIIGQAQMPDESAKSA